jgi:hypothetical protein
MDDWRRFAEESPLAERIKVPVRIVVHRFEASPAELAGIPARRALEPEGGEICEIVAGGKAVGRGRIVKRRGEWFVKVAQMGEEEP